MSPGRFSSRAVYMPVVAQTGKGKIYNLTGFIRSGSHGGRPDGKMCKKGRISGFDYQHIPGSGNGSDGRGLAITWN